MFQNIYSQMNVMTELTGIKKFAFWVYLKKNKLEIFLNKLEVFCHKASMTYRVNLKKWRKFDNQISLFRFF